MDDSRRQGPPAGSGLVIELSRRGRQLVGEPYFTPGLPIPLDLKGHGGLKVGELALVRTGRGRARVERELGNAKRIENVLEALLWEQGLRGDFEPFELTVDDHTDRVDLRDQVAVTIDPDTAKDYDDALFFRREQGGIRAFVHIADVSNFVAAGSPLDAGAELRGCSTYLPGLVAPMLPPSLADDACSLRPGEDRLCLTVEMPPDGPPLFYRSVIRSHARLTYSQAERREASPAVVEQLELAHELASALRARRFERGALDVTSLELVFRFEDGRVAGAARQAEHEAHMLVEELMIRANEHVATFLSSRGRATIYRVHERPEPRAIALLVEKLAALEVPTPPLPETLSAQQAAELAAVISRQVSEYVRQSGRGAEAFPSLVLRALKQARYDPANLGHSGLASPAYCHFTSPIRRYPDLVVHRALLAELGLGADLHPALREAVSAHASIREREAAALEYRADAICLTWLLEQRLFERGWETRWDGEITGMIGSGLFVRFGEVFEGFLPARRLPGEYFELNASATALSGRRSGRAYRLGDGINVRVEAASRHDGKVELALTETRPREPQPARARGSRRSSGRRRGG